MKIMSPVFGVHLSFKNDDLTKYKDVFIVRWDQHLDSCKELNYKNISRNKFVNLQLNIKL